MTRAAKERSRGTGVLLAALLVGLALVAASSAEASIPRGEPRGVLLEQPVPLLEQPPLLEVPAGEPVDTAATDGESLPLFGPGPGPVGPFDGVRIPAVERFQAETRYRVIELEAQVRAELELLQTSERTGFALFGGTESRRGSPNRYYDPELGRFISADPLGYVDGPSMYQYALNSPANFRDSLGLFTGFIEAGKALKATEELTKSVANLPEETEVPGWLLWKILMSGVTEDPGGPNPPVSEAGEAFIREHENFRSQLYLDVGGHCTIGYGHLVNHGSCSAEAQEKFGEGITREEGIRIFSRDMAREVDPALRLVTTTLGQAQIDAYGSLAFNVGSGALAHSRTLDAINSRDFGRASMEWLGWNRSGRQYWRGLYNRRVAELRIFWDVP